MASAYDPTTAFLQGVASDALTQASNNASRIWGLENVSAVTRDPRFAMTINNPDMGPPPQFGDLFGGDNTDPTIEYLNEQADAWVAKYFPALNECFKNDKTILDMVWNQARDRAGRTKRSEQATLAATFSNRGFSLVPGAMADQMAQLEQRASDVALDVSREQAIKDADIKVEMYKVALQLSTQLKTAILNSLADFYRMWITVPDKDIERAKVKAQAQAALYSALSSYYNVELAFEELRLKAGQTTASIDIDVDRNALTRQGNYMGIASPLASAVNAFANTAGNAAQAGSSLTAKVESL